MRFQKYRGTQDNYSVSFEVGEETIVSATIAAAYVEPFGLTEATGLIGDITIDSPSVQFILLSAIDNQSAGPYRLTITAETATRTLVGEVYVDILD